MKRPINYTVLIDIIGNYNQPAINDPINGVPVSAVEMMMSSCSTLSQCGPILLGYADSGFTVYNATQYLSYYSGL